MLQKIFGSYNSLVVVTVSALTNMNPPPVSLMGGQKQITYCISCKNGHGEDIRQWPAAAFWFSQVSMGLRVEWMGKSIIGQTEENVQQLQKENTLQNVMYSFNASKEKMKQLAVATNRSKTEKLTNSVQQVVCTLHIFLVVRIL